MSENRKHIESKDDFSEMVKQKLEHYEVPVDDAVWQGIEQRLQQQQTKKKNIIPLWPWLSGAAALLVIALLVTPMFFSNIPDSDNAVVTEERINNENKTTSPVAVKPVNKDKSKQAGTDNNVVTAELPEKTENKTTKPETPIAENITRHYNNAQWQPQTDELTAQKGNEPIYQDEEYLKPADNDIAFITPSETETETPASGITENVPYENIEPSEKMTVEDFERLLAEAAENGNTNKPEEGDNKKNKWLVAANVASGGRFMSAGGGEDFATANALPPLYPSMADFIPDNNNSSSLNPDDFDDVNYLPALSFGLNVRKTLNKTFAIEAGLLYTYLHTTFEKTMRSKQDATLDLHYLGIPLNIVMQIYNRGNWNVYFSAGGTIEKGLRSVCNQDIYVGSKVYKNNVSESIDGFQTSVNASVGAGYRFYRGLGVYIEPRVSYYFDNDQPVSIRTESPFNIGMSLGLRYDF